MPFKCLREFGGLPMIGLNDDGKIKLNWINVDDRSDVALSVACHTQSPICLWVTDHKVTEKSFSVWWKNKKQKTNSPHRDNNTKTTWFITDILRKNNGCH